MHQAALAGALGRTPAGIEQVWTCGQEPDVAAILRHQPDRLDRLERDRAGIGDHDLTSSARAAQPAGAVDDRLPQVGRHRAA